MQMLRADLLTAPLPDLMQSASERRNRRSAGVVTYSPNVFLPLTKLCRDVCHYCEFAEAPVSGRRVYMTAAEVLDIARRGVDAGAREALFTLGDRPEARYRVAREELASLSSGSTVEYLARMCRLVLDETGLLPHVNAGVLSRAEILLLRPLSASMGLMLEGVSARLAEPGGPHYGSPDKEPGRRIRFLEEAGKAGVPTTTGILVGIGETRMERIESLLTIARLHEPQRHIQEVIVQNFVPKPGTKMAAHSAPSVEELLWTVAVARLILPEEISIQAPPNLNPEHLGDLLSAGVDDWGGISSITPDHVSPRARWPSLDLLRSTTEDHGFDLAPRLCIHPGYARNLEDWTDPRVASGVRQVADSSGLARESSWAAGASGALELPRLKGRIAAQSPSAQALGRLEAGHELDHKDICALFEARGRALDGVLEAADELRRQARGADVTYVVNRNINYTNVCYFRCGFCAFSKTRPRHDPREAPYLVPLEEIVRRTAEAHQRGATEVCLQGGIHPGFTGQYYLDLCTAIKAKVPDIHVHAFSALEIWQGAATLGIGLEKFLAKLADSGLASLPGTAAEILDDRIRRVLCPDKLSSAQWLQVHSHAHSLGLRSTATIMFGAVELPEHWANHLLKIRDLQKRTGGFTEFVPLPFVHAEAPIFKRGEARPGPTEREALLMHAVARLTLHPHITNIQASWVKLGPLGALRALQSGANDLGGTLMNESISRAAGAEHGQEMAPARMDFSIRSIGRRPRQRTTLHGRPSFEAVRASYDAQPLKQVESVPVREAGLRRLERLVRPGLEVPAA